MEKTRRRFIASTGLFLGTGAGCIGQKTSGGSSSADGDSGGKSSSGDNGGNGRGNGGTNQKLNVDRKEYSEDKPVVTAPIPKNPTSYDYAVMGKSKSNTTITYVGNWKCPFCARFSSGLLKEIARKYVAKGDINLRYRTLALINGKTFLGPDAPDAARAGLAVWNNEPGKYWAFHEEVFKNQPPESQAWAKPDRLIKFAKNAGVEKPSVIRKAINQKKYQNLIESTGSYANRNNIRGTPALVIGNQTLTPSEKNKNKVFNAIENQM